MPTRAGVRGQSKYRTIARSELFDAIWPSCGAPSAARIQDGDVYV